MSLATNIVIGIISGMLFLLLLIIGIRFFRNRRLKNLGKNIEQQINPNLSIDNLIKKANFFAQEKQYVHSIIYLIYYFRKICKKYYRIKNAIVLDFNEFPTKLVGYNSISIGKLRKILAIYEIAYFNSEKLTYEDFLQVKDFVLNLPKDP
ncbi:MAG: hypothetical protein FK733_01180 [Asgard group archaeon]|nr:hypothetical protein [Asgard group archaeon]